MEQRMDEDSFKICKERYLSRSRAKGKGQNKIWTAEVVLYGGVLAKDPELVQYAAETILSELHLTTKEGLQHDWSFHLHGPQNQIGTYGSAFSTDMAKWAYVYEDTRLAFSGDQLALLRNFLLKGQGWVAWNGILDINCRGRTVGRLSATSRYDYLLPTARLMRKIDPQHADGYTAYIKRSSVGANDLIGNKHFWRSDLMVHRARNWYASVRMCSTRTIGGESCNNENLRGRYAADGVLLLYTTGREYEDIFPVWGWRRLPGLTCLQAAVPPTKPHRLRGTTDFVGGVSDGKSGCAALDYDRDGLRARKSWFFLHDAIVCLGTDIRTDEKELVTTSVNQCLLKSKVAEDNQWYWHDSVGYFFSSPQEVVLQCGPQKGNWRQISELEYLIDEEVAKDVFSLWIDHGEKPQDGKYAYVLFPGIPAEEMPAKVKHNRILVLRNDSDCQAVADGAERKTLIAFRKPGNIDIGYERKLAVDQPCLIIAAEMERGLKLSIADPTQTLGIVNVEITGEIPVAVQLPAGPYRGQSVPIDLFKRRRGTDVR
jgi:chondroitin AC lyase